LEKEFAMAKKASTVTKTSPKGAVTKATPAASTAVRNTPIPKITTAVRKEVTFDMISRRAYEIFISGTGGSEQDNWHRAERELKGL
jgi:hypothetical protein